MSEQHPQGDPGGQEQAAGRSEGSGASLTQKVGRVVVGLIIVLFAIFAIDNAQFVDFSWIFGETRVQLDQTGERSSGGVPLIALLVVTFAFGIISGALLSWQSSRSKRRAARSA